MKKLVFLFISSLLLPYLAYTQGVNPGDLTVKNLRVGASIKLSPLPGLKDSAIIKVIKDSLQFKTLKGANSFDKPIYVQGSKIVSFKDTLSKIATTQTVKDSCASLRYAIKTIEPPAGGYANNLYFDTLTSTVVPAYKTLTYTPSSFSHSQAMTVNSSEGEKLIGTFIYPSGVGETLYPSGVWSFDFYGLINSASGVTQIGIQYFKRSITDVETNLFTSWSSEITNTTNDWIKFSTTQPTFTVAETDKMGARLLIKTTAAVNKTVTVYIGDGYGAYISTPNRIRHSQLRALNGDTSYLHVTNTEKVTWNNKLSASGTAANSNLIQGKDTTWIKAQGGGYVDSSKLVTKYSQYTTGVNIASGQTYKINEISISPIDGLFKYSSNTYNVYPTAAPNGTLIVTGSYADNTNNGTGYFNVNGHIIGGNSHVSNNKPGVYGRSYSGYGVMGVSSGIGGYFNSNNSWAVSAYGQSAGAGGILSIGTNIAIKAEGDTGIYVKSYTYPAGIFNINSDNESNILELKSGDSIKAYCNKYGDVAANKVNSKSIALDTTYSGVLKKGETKWNDTDKCLETYLGDGVTVQNNNEVPIYVQNNTGSLIPAGKLVYFIAAGGEVPRIKLADNRYMRTAYETIGMTTSSIAHGSNGFVCTFGKVHELNTSGMEGAHVYLSTNGDYTSTKPTTGHIIKVGFVPYGHVSNGIVFVKIENESNTSILVGNNTAVNSVLIDTINGIRLGGDATNFKDLYPSSVSTGSGVNAASFTAYNGANLFAYEFIGAVTLKSLQIGFQINHDYKEGSDITPHIHLYIPDDGTGGVIKFYMTYAWSNVSQTGSISETTISGTVTRTASQGINNNAILSFPAITGTGKTISSIIMCRIYRDPADAADTFASSVWLKSADIHYEIDGLGSSTITAK